MVLSTTQPNTPAFSNTNKENIVLVVKSPTVLRNSNSRRPRSRPSNTPSPVVMAARDPGRRRTHSPPVRTPKSPVGDADVEMVESANSSASTSTSVHQSHVRIPRYLTRPAFKAISPEALEAVDPDLKEVALEYVLEKLQRVGQQLLSIAVTATGPPPTNGLPRELEVVIKNDSAEVPTHLFAVYSKGTSKVAIHPVHALVFAAHCAHLPPIPFSKPTAPTAAGEKVKLPVVPLCVPSPKTFPILLHYLYTKNGGYLLGSLMPFPPQHGSQSREELAQIFAATFTAPALLSYASRVFGLSNNVAALGVFDESLWRAMEMVWDVLTRAFVISTGLCWQSE